MFTGNGAGLTNLNAANLIGAYSNANVAAYLPTYTGNLTANNISAIGNLTAGNLAITGNSLTTAVANGNLTITTQGTGALNLHSEFIEMYTINNTLPSFQIANTGDVRIYAPSFNSAVGALAVIGSPDGNTIAPQNQGVMLHLTGETTTPARVYNDGINNYAAFVGRRINGNVDAPTQVLANSIVSRYAATPYNSAGWPAISTARIDLVTTEDQTNTNQGTEIQFWTTANGTNTTSQVMSVTNNDIKINGDLAATGNATFSTNINYENHITVSGTTYDAQIVIDDIGANNVAQLILTRSSTSVQPIIASALNNSDDPTANVDVVNGQTLFQLATLGFAGVDYKEFAGIVIQVDDNGTVSETSSPGKLVFRVTPDGSTSTNSALTIYNDATAEFTANVQVDGNLSVTGNITGDYFFGNGSLLTGIITSVANINNGNTNVTAYANGNVAVTIAGTANTVVFTDTGIEVASAAGNVVSTTGNISAGYLYGNGSQLTGISSTGTVIGGNLLILTRSSGIIDATIVAGYVIVLARSGNIDMPVSS